MPKPPKFLACTVTHTGRANLILSDVKLCSAYDPAKPPAVTPPFFDIKAIWDTGASRSMITSATVSAMGLSPIGLANVNHAGGVEQKNTYLLNFVLPSNVTVYGVVAAECANIVGGVGALIGMDIICQGDFAITNVQGLTCMSFRIPSVVKIDYVVESNKYCYADVRRNGPCLCGKKDNHGNPLKFKNCCAKTLGLE
jgi:hypothetical protein